MVGDKFWHYSAIMQIRVTTYQNDNGTYYVVQVGSIINGRWKTGGGSLMRAEKLFCIEEEMKSPSDCCLSREYKAAKVRTKIKAEVYAAEWAKKLGIELK